MLNKQFFTAESVTEGHPDKICDQISDAVLDAILAQDPDARVACETCCTTGMVMIMGEISTSCYVDIPSIARNVVLEIGYDRAKYGFDGTTCSVLTSIDEQSKDIALGVDHSLETKEGGEENNGAGDQGMMFGYALSLIHICNVDVQKDVVYFSVNYSVPDESVSIGWRTGYRLQSSVYYRKNLKTGISEKLYELQI